MVEEEKGNDMKNHSNFNSVIIQYYILLYESIMCLQCEKSMLFCDMMIHICDKGKALCVRSKNVSVKTFFFKNKEMYYNEKEYVNY